MSRQGSVALRVWTSRYLRDAHRSWADATLFPRVGKSRDMVWWCLMMFNGTKPWTWNYLELFGTNMNQQDLRRTSHRQECQPGNKLPTLWAQAVYIPEKPGAGGVDAAVSLAKSWVRSCFIFRYLESMHILCPCYSVFSQNIHQSR